MGLTLTLIPWFYISNSQIHLLPEILKGLSNSKCHKVYAIFLFLSVQKLYPINFFAVIPEKSELQPTDIKGRDMSSISFGSSGFRLSYKDSRLGQLLEIDEEESSRIEFGASDMKYLLYEDEQDFKVRFMRRHLEC